MYLSPLHGALLAATAVNGGRWHDPVLVECPLGDESARWLEDLEAAYRGATLPPKTTSFQQWARRLAGHAEALTGELSSWRETAQVSVPRLPVDFPSGGDLVGDEATVSFELSAEETAALTKAQVLNQAGIAVLSIANQNPQQVLQLLG